MSIVGHSIPPNRQLAFPLKSSGSSQDACQHLHVACLWSGTYSTTSFWPNWSKQTSPIISSRDRLQGESSACRVPAISSDEERLQNGTPQVSNKGVKVIHDKVLTATMANNPECNSLPLHFLYDPHSEKEETFYQINDEVGEFDHCISSNHQAIMLSATVSSAVKLDSRQIDLITRKLQRLTGFRNFRMESIIDPSLIAGFIISYDNHGLHMIDLSVKSQLAALATRVESSYQSQDYRL